MRIAHEALVLLAVDYTFGANDRATARPSERTGETGIEHDQHVAAREREERVVHERHVEKCRIVSALGVGGQEISVRAWPGPYATGKKIAAFRLPESTERAIGAVPSPTDSRS
jgi:hypothetical protein